jgi:hypothetical protein
MLNFLISISNLFLFSLKFDIKMSTYCINTIKLYKSLTRSLIIVLGDYTTVLDNINIIVNFHLELLSINIDYTY